MQNILIIGAGGFGREVQWLIERINAAQSQKGNKDMYHILGYLDDGVSVGTEVNGYKVLGGVNYLEKCEKPVAVTCAIGASITRSKVMERVAAYEGILYPNLTDPSVIMSERITLGKGNIICAGNILTVDITVKDFCIINLDCTVGHDVVMDSFVTVYPGVHISGNTHFETCVEAGTGAQIIQGKTIGEKTIIGAGTVVIGDLPANCTAVGNPARIVKQRG